jgi:hypothetical protein
MLFGGAGARKHDLAHPLRNRAKATLNAASASWHKSLPWTGLMRKSLRRAAATFSLSRLSCFAAVQRGRRQCQSVRVRLRPRISLLSNVRSAAGGSRRAKEAKSQYHVAPTVRPNRSLNRTRYGRQRKPGPRHMVHHRAPGLRCLPPRSG